MKAPLLAALAALLMTVNVSAQVDTNSKELQTIEGRVGEFLQPGLFWVQGSDGVKVLIYSNNEATKDLLEGQKVRVSGYAPIDWAKLVDQELQAKKISVL